MKKQTMKMIALGAVMLVLTAAGAKANPAERAHILKGLLLQVLMADGWQLIQESESMITVQRQAGVGQSILMALGTGANSTLSTVRLSFALVPRDDHYTTYYAAWSLNNQNAFGMVTSVPMTHKSCRAYDESMSKIASSRLPAKYRFKP
jgi:hypothetical protein